MKKKIVIRDISDILTNISLKQEEEKEQLRVTGTATPAEDREEEEEKDEKKKKKRGELPSDTNTRRHFKNSIF
jgi:hypothetical protein